MAKQLDPLLKQVLLDYGEDPTPSGGAVWDCHGTWVVYHKAIERIAARAKIIFEMPQIIEANTAAKTVAIAVAGHMGDRSEWSFGEASPGNNKNAYPYSMAEKRAKDRVVLKLVGLHGLAYSEEEADDFKPAVPVEPTPLVEQVRAKEPPRKANGRPEVGWREDGTRTSHSLKQDKDWPEFEREVLEARSVTELTKIAFAWSALADKKSWNSYFRAQARDYINDRKEWLLKQPAPDDDIFPGDLPSQYGNGSTILAGG
jgi:hypothetical protein